MGWPLLLPRVISLYTRPISGLAYSLLCFCLSSCRPHFSRPPCSSCLAELVYSPCRAPLCSPSTRIQQPLLWVVNSNSVSKPQHIATICSQIFHHCSPLFCFSKVSLFGASCSVHPSPRIRWHSSPTCVSLHRQAEHPEQTHLIIFSTMYLVN